LKNPQGSLMTLTAKQMGGGFLPQTKAGTYNKSLGINFTVEIHDRITPSCDTIGEGWKGAYTHWPAYSSMRTDMFLAGQSQLPPIHTYIWEEYHAKGRGRWQDKSTPYGRYYPKHLVQYGNLEDSINNLRWYPQDVLDTGTRSYIYGKMQQSAIWGDDIWTIKLKLGQYFGNYPRKFGPKKGKGVGYVWLQEFGWGVPKKSFIIPALRRAAIDYKIGFDASVFAAKEILENTKRSGVKSRITRSRVSGPISTANIGVIGKSSISMGATKDTGGFDWFSLIWWILPTHRYMSIMAAAKDIVQLVQTGITVEIMKDWLLALALGSEGLTIKSQRRAFRRAMYGG